jgi:cytoskeleton-associated protein 5
VSSTLVPTRIVLTRLIPPADLIPALKLRMSDSNKIVQGLALDVVARIATGMGKPFDKHSRTFAAPIANILADQKVHVRAGAIATLTAIADAAGLDSLVGGLDKPLESPNPILRKELLAWLEVRFADEDVVATLDLSSIAGGILSCLEDRNVDVRKSATAVLPIVVARAGYNYVIDLTSKLKPASRSTVVPLIEAARGSGAAPSQAKSSAPAPSKPAAAIRPAGKSLRAGAPTPVPQDDPPSRPASVRPPTASRPKSAAPSSRASPVPSSPSIREAPFKSADPYPKQVRASKETGSMKWVIDVNPRPEQVESLLTQMTSNTSPDLLAQLFSKDHSAEKDFVAGLTLLEQCARDPNVAEGYGLSTEEMRARLVANVDVIFKYITLRIGMSSTTITVKCLDLIDHLIPVLDAEGHKLSDYETSALLLSLINKVSPKYCSLSVRR